MRKNFINIWGNYISRIIPGELFYPQPSGKITDNLFTLCDRDDTNIFIYTDGKDTICIDAGYINNNYLKDDFKKIGIDPRSISHIFLTHTDMDHAGALDSDSKSDWLSSAEIFVGREEADLLEKRRRRRFVFYTPVEITKRYNSVIDNDVITIGNIEVKAIHTPGHTPGHMSYLINDAVLCTGDLLLLKDGAARPFYFIWNNDHDLDKQSIRKIAGYDNVEILCTAHSKCSFDYHKALENWK